MAFLTYDENNLIGAGARVMYAPYSTTIPAFPSDIFDGTSPYAPASGWLDFGATSGPPVIGRNITTAGFNIQQTSTVLLEEITEINRSLTVPIAEFSPTILALLEESTVATYAAAAKRGTGSKVAFGNINSFSSFRLALFAQKSKQQGVVTEGATTVTRGAFFGWTAYKASFAAGNLQASIGRGTLAELSVEFKVYPDPDVATVNGESGFWMLENGGQTVATS